MINYNYLTDFKLDAEGLYESWLTEVCKTEGFNINELNYIFCDDSYLLKINQDYLQHDYLTDIISFDYVLGKDISGDLYISIDRVRENAEEFSVTFENELKRVMVHGVLHLMGYSDKMDTATAEMRAKEEEKIKLFHVEQ
ncbi:rRNA maturation RNase YbeY [Maribacter sp. ACAM166]|uniref:rRNA maturation RNase YbeY n=1 Tax=Maribacter sp. ACAM166 TaxID=2508996 RepID=UPI0010FCDFAF|nr:rRNA maturation RNase YbeY [Maribacter sp. ACAM166]TLP80720.1 rRNA maturation RNase YbeY [Maribacter sp. ACAM166]